MKILDLYCKAGGAAYGLKQAFPEATICGVDIEIQRNYPYHFVQGDAIEILLRIGKDFDLIWASPPCQAYSFASTGSEHRDKYPDLVAPTRDALRLVSRPYIMENVPGAPLHYTNILLCGMMFDLDVIRHRNFETNPRIKQPVHPSHTRNRATGGIFTVAGHHRGSLKDWRFAMGIHWMNKEEIRQAVPPAYAKYVAEAVGRKMKWIK